MGLDTFEFSINLFKMLAIFLIMFQMVPILVWIERRGSAFIQNRVGPNRVGPFGLLQLLADAVKFLFKENFVPTQGRKFIFYLAPILAPLSAALAFGALPISLPVRVESFELFERTWGPYDFLAQSYHFDLGLIFVLGVSSLGVYSLLMAGWASGNKFSLLGAMRASAQFISYELSLSLSLVGMLLIYQTFNFSEMIELQRGPMEFVFLGQEVQFLFLPNWGIFYQPFGALLFFVATFAESNRLPFDLPEAEGEIVAGYHIEYGGMKMLLFYIGEYMHMMVASALMVIFYFGGFDIPFLSNEEVFSFFEVRNFSPTLSSLFTSITFALSFFVKFAFFMWCFIWVRWTLPRFRYDQLMDIGWKTMLPWALGNTMLTAFILFLMRT